MRGSTAQGTPRLRQWRHLFRGRARLQAESDLDRFLDRYVARRPGVAMAEAEQQVDVRASTAMPFFAVRSACCARRRRLHGEHVEVSRSARDFAVRSALSV